jgi:hypothetical protein
MKVIKRKNLLMLKFGMVELLQKTDTTDNILKRIVVTVGLKLVEFHTPPRLVLEKIQELSPSIELNNIKNVTLAQDNGLQLNGTVLQRLEK